MAEPRRRIVENIGVVRSAGGGMLAAGRAIDAFAAELDQRAERQDAVSGERAGREAALQRDENGSLVFQPLAGTGAFAQAYNRAARSAYASQLENDAAERAATLRKEIGDDSARFASQWQGYRNGVLEGVDKGIRADAQLILDHVGRTHATAIVNAERQRDYQAAGRAHDARMAGVERDMASLAETGGFNTPAFLELASKHAALLDEGVAAKFFTEDEKQFRAATIDGRSRAHAIAATAEGAYRRGGLAAANRVLEGILKDPSLTISSADRQRIVNVTQSRLRELDIIRRMGVADARDAAQDAQRRLALGYQVDPGEIRKHADRMQSLGDRDGAQRLRSAATFQDDLSAFGRLPLQEQQQQIRELEAPLLAGKGTAEAAERVQAYRKAMGWKAQALAEDPLAYGARAHRGAIEGDLAPLDLSSPDAWAASIERRRQQAARISSIEGVPVSPLQKAEAANIVKLLNDQPDSASQFDRAEQILAGLPAPSRAAVAQSLEAAGFERERIYMIERAREPGMREEMRRQFSALGLPQKEAEKLLTPEQIKDLKQRVHDAYAPRRELMAAIADDLGESGYLAAAQREQDTVQRAAVARAAGQQKTAGGIMGNGVDAAGATVNAFFGHQAIINEPGFARVFYPQKIEQAEPGVFRAGLAALRTDPELMGPEFAKLPEAQKRQVMRVAESSAWYPLPAGPDGQPRFALVPIGAPAGSEAMPNYRVRSFTLEEILDRGRVAALQDRARGLPELPAGAERIPDRINPLPDLRGDATLMERTQRAVNAPAAPDLSDAVKAMVPRFATSEAIQAEIDRRKKAGLPTAELERGLELARKREAK